MESAELALNDMTIGQRMVLAAQLAVARHWFNDQAQRQAASANQDSIQDSIGGADRRSQRITDDPAG